MTVASPKNRAIPDLFSALPYTQRIFDIEQMAYFLAAQESAKFFMENMRMAENLVDRIPLLTFALEKRKIEGLTLEFGVGVGTSFRVICEKTPGPAYGFDSFLGLPEDWTHFQKKGRFSNEGKVPTGMPPNANFVVGLFEESLPPFLEEHPEPASFVHVDCDLYSSAKTVLTLLAPRMRSGTIILFDEYLNYPGWQHHEHKAFREYIETTNFDVEYLGFASGDHSVAVRLK